MAKNDNPHALRFLQSMAEHGVSADGDAFAAAHPLSKSADYQTKFLWAKELCAFLLERYDEKTVQTIRMDCACGPENGKLSKLKTLYVKEKDPYRFAEKSTALKLGFSVEYDGTYYYLVYPECYCSCVKRVPENLPTAWCCCTLGYTRRMFESIFEKTVQVSLLSSVKQGDSCCRIRICLTNDPC